MMTSDYPFAAVDGPRIWMPNRELTFHWLGSPHNFHTVQEFNTWPGRDVSDDQEIERTRHTVLMECDHNAILKIVGMLYEKDLEAVETIMRAYDLKGIVGYDFQRAQPRILLYPPW